MFVKRYTIPDSLKRISLFQNHLLRAKNSAYKFHYTHHDYLSSSVLFISLIIFVLLYVSNSKRLNQIIKGFYINRFANQLSHEEFSFGNRVNVLLSILFVLTITLFISETLQYYGLEIFALNHSFLSPFIVIAIIVTYLIKLTTIKFCGFIFLKPKLSTEYIMTTFLFCNSLSLVLLPVIHCLSFIRQVSPVIFIHIGSILIITLILTRIVRGLIIGFNITKNSKFYLFLYLCTLEVLPFVVIVKLSTLIIK